MSDKTATVRKLLAKAERATTEAEAQIYREKATALMITYSIDEAVLSAAHESTDTIGSLRIVLTGGYSKAESQLLAGIVDAFGGKTVRLSSTHGSQMLTVYGWQSDLDKIDILFASLRMQGMREAKMSHARNRHVNGRTWTTSFLIGFASTVWTRLKAQRSQAVADTGNSTGTELVLVDRSKAVAAHMRSAHPRTSKSQGSTVRGTGAYYSGKAAGERADLGQGGLAGRRVALAR